MARTWQTNLEVYYKEERITTAISSLSGTLQDRTRPHNLLIISCIQILEFRLNTNTQIDEHNSNQASMALI
jgi:hypothetical protein